MVGDNMSVEDRLTKIEGDLKTYRSVALVSLGFVLAFLELVASLRCPLLSVRQ
jgi:hypothetical protein